jgi:hypothetical protein
MNHTRNHNRWRRALRLGLAVVSVSIIAIGLSLTPAPSGQQTAQAQSNTATPTVTPTRRPGSRARLLLKGLSRTSPDGVGDLKAQVKLQGDGEWNSTTFEWVPAEEAKQLAASRENGRLRAQFAVFQDTPNGRVEVYRHTERTAPFCMFRETGNRCNAIPFVNGEYRWPDSDGQPGSSTPLTPGQFIIEINGFAYVDGNDDDTFGNWFSAPEFTLEFGEADAPAELPRQTGRAAIVSPRNNSVLRGIVNIRGTATSNNFAFYKFEFEDARCAGGVCFVAEGRRAVANGTLLRWDTRTVPNGTYQLRLVVVDRFGRELGQVPRVQVTIAN